MDGKVDCCLCSGFSVVVLAVWQHKTKGDTAAFQLSGLGAEEERREEHD